MLTPQNSHTTFKTTVIFNTLSLIALKLSEKMGSRSTSIPCQQLLWRRCGVGDSLVMQQTHGEDGTHTHTHTLSHASISPLHYGHD